jgi:UDP-N-acetyl-2-amino-2-deoxyglucuronate dehydrogenase
MLSFAIIGCGRIGLRYAQIIGGMKGCKLLAAADPLFAKGGITGFPLNEAALFSCASKMLGSGIHFDIVCICSPNGLHAQHCLLALERGCNVICEKPLSLKTVDAEKLRILAKKLQLSVFCTVQNRFSPAAAWLKDSIENGLLGEIRIASAAAIWNRSAEYYKLGTWHGSAELDGGILFTQFSHFIDMLIWLLGPLSAHTAQFANYAHSGCTEFDDTANIQFSFGASGIGNILCSTAGIENTSENSICIIGSKATATLSGQYMDEVSRAAGIEAPVLKKLSCNLNNHRLFIEDAASVVKSGCCQYSSLDDAIETVKFIEAAYKLKQA